MRQSVILHASAIAVILLCSGCVSRKPLRAIPAEERAGAEVFYAGSGGAIRHSTVNTRNTRAAGVEGGLIGGVMMIIAGAVESGSGGWMTAIREKTGEFEPDLLMQKVAARLEELHGTVTNKTGAPVFEIRFTEVGLPELQRGWFGAYATAGARLKDANGKEVWASYASSTATKLRRRADFEMDPALYQQDFEEVADDIARQLVHGPIRGSRRI